MLQLQLRERNQMKRHDIGYSAAWKRRWILRREHNFYTRSWVLKCFLMCFKSERELLQTTSSGAMPERSKALSGHTCAAIVAQKYHLGKAMPEWPVNDIPEKSSREAAWLQQCLGAPAVAVPRRAPRAAEISPSSSSPQGWGCALGRGQPRAALQPLWGWYSQWQTEQHRRE